MDVVFRSSEVETTSAALLPRGLQVGGTLSVGKAGVRSRLGSFVPLHRPRGPISPSGAVGLCLANSLPARGGIWASCSSFILN